MNEEIEELKKIKERETLKKLRSESRGNKKVVLNLLLTE